MWALWPGTISAWRVGMSASRVIDAHEPSAPPSAGESIVGSHDKREEASRPATVLVSADLTEAARPVVQSGADIVRRHGGRLVVCHVVPGTPRINPLFPQRLGESMAATTENEHRIVDALTEQVAAWTGLPSFDVIVDFGDRAQVLCEQAKRLGADLLLVAAGEEGDALVEGLADSSCQVRIVGRADERDVV
jgi:nucleotide-binding universal stress UspA family protein